VANHWDDYEVNAGGGPHDGVLSPAIWNDEIMRIFSGQMASHIDKTIIEAVMLETQEMRPVKDPKIAARDAESLAVLIDADILVYRIGFYANRDTTEMTPLPILTARMDAMKDAIWRDVHVGLGVSDASSEEVCFLTGCKQVANFRDEVAPYYKANRAENSKPPYYEEIRAYIQKEYPTIVTEGMEADDYFGQAAKDAVIRNPNVLPVIVSIDKDLLMIPGVHYNFVKKEMVYVDEFDANLFFFTQMLTGDRADNIPGLKGYGPKKAEKILKGVPDINEMIKRVFKEYEKVHSGDAWHQWDIHCDLLWILRTLDQICPYRSDQSFMKPTVQPDRHEAVPF
jgi:5'-3' exonuclease